MPCVIRKDIGKMSLQTNIKQINNITRHFNKLSNIFQPINVLPKNAVIKKQDMTSNSQRLMLDLGIIRQANPGCFHLLPLGLRALEKLVRLVDAEMQQIGAQKIELPALTSSELWKTTGRLETGASELFMLKDRHNKKYVLSPTHEESICDLIASVSPISYKQCPLKLYQITNKFRDEIKPRFGLMRGRQFLMKDLYTFDIDKENALKTYETVCETYNRIFNQIGVPYIKVLGTTGNIGGSISHEYQFPAEIGEDQLLICQTCNYTSNVELCGSEKCPKCENTDIVIKSGIEVGHTFLLGEKYSKPLNAQFLAVDAKPRVLQMGCYGLGLSRVLAASIEVLSTENEIRWPNIFAPFTAVIIPPKAGSKEEEATQYCNEIYLNLDKIQFFANNVLIDDRNQMTIGKRLFEAKRVGYPFIIILGNGALQNPPIFEVHDLRNNTKHNLTQSDMYCYLKEKSI